MATTADSTPSISSLSIHSRSNPIDLTLDDDDNNSSPYIIPRSKRAPTDTLDSTDQCLPPSYYAGSLDSYHPFSQSYHSPPPNTDRFFLRPEPSSTPHFTTPSPNTGPYLPPFASRNQPTPVDPYQQEHQHYQRQTMPQYQQHSPQVMQQASPPPRPLPPPPDFRFSLPPLSSERQVIDLTGSPSPPPSAVQNVPPGLTLSSPDDPPKTPVCIGQLTVKALILYPNPYLIPRDPTQETEWAPVKLHYDYNLNKIGNNNPDTIYIRPPSERAPNGDIIPGDNFAFIERRVVASLSGMVGKGLIRFEAKIRREQPPVSSTLLLLFVYTPKGNITVVGNYLQQCNLLLEHPTPPYDNCRVSACPYFNPHNPPLGNYNHSLHLNNRLFGPDSGLPRWPVTTGKTTDVQRSQVDELFKNLKDGVELTQTEPTPDVATRLYPHQKKALTFLLDREHEIPAIDGKFSSLWRMQVNPMSQQRTWVNIVTEEDRLEEPKEAKGAILADDMGLGKTITCVSLIAATLQSARDFAAQHLEPPQPPPPREEQLDPSHFAGSIWGMPDHPSGKTKGKSDKLQEKLEAEYVRACRIKARSRATLIICPLSTVANWEDQFREHWRGEVTVVGGNGNGSAPAPSSTACATTSVPPTALNGATAMDLDEKPEKIVRSREGNPLRVYIYHGNARRPDPTFLADFDAVITTYATLASEFSKQSRSAQAATDDGDDGGSSDGGGIEFDENGNSVIRVPPPKKAGMKRKKPTAATLNTEVASALQSIHWFRVVLDEAHSIKETQTVGSRASCDLAADRRLCLTGTPVQNKLDDMFALIKFLRLEPFDDKNIWTKHVSAPAKFGQREGVLKLRTIMACITLRRTKETKTPDGQRILSLPPRKDEIIRLQLNPFEQEIYNEYFQESKAEFTDLTRKNLVMKNYVGILQKLLRLRQICDHKELVEAKGSNTDSDPTPSYEDIIAAISKEGVNHARASAIFAILREAATTQCTECGGELCTTTEGTTNSMDTEGPPPHKRGRKTKGQTSRAPTRASSPSGGPRPVLTRCQHLFCIECYRASIFPGWPDVPATLLRPCSACQTELSPSDAVEIKHDAIAEVPPSECRRAKKETREERVQRQERRLQELEQKLTLEVEEQANQTQPEPQPHYQEQFSPYPQMQQTQIQPETQSPQLFQLDGSQEYEMQLQTDVLLAPPAPSLREQAVALLQEEIFQRSTKIRVLIQHLLPYSIANPHSANYNPAGLDLQIVDSHGNHLADNVVKTVVFSQWTSMLDKIEDALLLHKIRYDRLDGTMKREERTRAMDALKHDPGCEVLLVSLKAGGVGLNLTAAQRVILVDPYWNPAVENQAVDRIHRLGQTKPVSSIKLIISNSIEERMLVIQEKKTKLAEITLGVRTKAEIMKERIEQLQELFK